MGEFVQGGGTVVRIVHNYWPQRKMKAWELDAIVLSISKDYFGLQDLVDAGILVRVLSNINPSLFKSHV